MRRDNDRLADDTKFRNGGETMTAKFELSTPKNDDSNEINDVSGEPPLLAPTCFDATPITEKKPMPQAAYWLKS